MVSKISEGINITVENFYQPEYSNPAKSEYLFSYKINIRNENAFPVQLISRHWYITEDCGHKREVEGEGVVGIQPVIQSGAVYEYTSYCKLQSEIGMMYGTYKMINLFNQQHFNAGIPVFKMTAPFKLN
jgi:ApaG protein